MLCAVPGTEGVQIARQVGRGGTCQYPEAIELFLKTGLRPFLKQQEI